MAMKVNRDKLKKVGALLLIGAAYYIFVMLTGVGISCPVYTLSRHRIKCPGCGMSRACISLAHLDIKAAFCYHPAFIVLSPLMAASLFAWLIDKAERFRLIADIIILVVLLVYCVLRNIPSFPLN